jgi:hypothetical protein
VFRLLGETGSHASVLNDVMLETIGGLPGGTPRCRTPAAAGWCGTYSNSDDRRSVGLPLRRVPDGELMRMCEARRALGGGWSVRQGDAARWRVSMRWTGSSSAGRSRRSRRCGNRLAETLVAIEGAEATLDPARDDNPDLTALAGQGRLQARSADRSQALPASARP